MIIAELSLSKFNGTRGWLTLSLNGIYIASIWGDILELGIWEQRWRIILGVSPTNSVYLYADAIIVERE